MGKPFKLEGESRANVARAGDGKFQRLVQASPQKVADKAQQEGETLREADRTERVPDCPVTETPTEEGGDMVYKETLPWPEAGPYNDANKPPMKLRS